MAVSTVLDEHQGDSKDRHSRTGKRADQWSIPGFPAKPANQSIEQKSAQPDAAEQRQKDWPTQCIIFNWQPQKYES